MCCSLLSRGTVDRAYHMRCSRFGCYDLCLMEGEIMEGEMNLLVWLLAAAAVIILAWSIFPREEDPK